MVDAKLLNIKDAKKDYDVIFDKEIKRERTYTIDESADGKSDEEESTFDVVNKTTDEPVDRSAMYNIEPSEGIKVYLFNHPKSNYF